MKQLYFPFLVLALFLTAVSESGCDEDESDCGELVFDAVDASGTLFLNPAYIYWGEINGVRSYTYNFAFENICKKQNPKVNFDVGLSISNAGSGVPFTIEAGVYTCLGVQPHQVTMVPEANQKFYSAGPTEIGLQQCFSSQPTASVYPYITISFNTLGSSHADSIYLEGNIYQLRAGIEHRAPI